MSTFFALTQQPIVVATPERQPIFLASEVSGYDSIDLQVTCFVDGTAAGATIGLITSMQMESEDGWLAVPDGFTTISGSGLQFARMTISAGMLRYLRWEVSSLGGASNVTIFLTGVARSLLSTGEPWQRGLIAWHAAKSWAEVYAEIQAAGADATVFLGNGYTPVPGAYTIPPGEYDINLVSFVCVGRFGLITVEDGATFVPLPGGGYNFTLDGVALYTNGAIVSPGENVSCNLTNGAGVIHTSNTTAAFPGVIGGVLLASDSLLGATLWSYGSEPVFDVATSSLLQITLNVALSFGSATIGGDGEVYLEADSASLRALNAALLTGSTTYQAGSPKALGTVLERYANATRPAASSVLAGTLIFNTDDNFPNVSDGTNWRDMSGAIT